jgi:cell division protein ZapA
VNAEQKALTINVMGREFRVACPDGEEKQLLASVEFLNRRLREVKETGKVVGNDRIALMAALNIAHEFLSQKGGKPVDLGEFRGRIVAMQETLDRALAADQEKLF